MTLGLGEFTFSNSFMISTFSEHEETFSSSYSSCPEKMEIMNEFEKVNFPNPSSLLKKLLNYKKKKF